ncbi:hypothetical protein [Streptomyces sp. V1I1]|uniref:hypothetical protein n=1 Tax=Streptomyces sp. V1I1 TaxID=3042272 RepID=UPI00277DAD4D|nr:hypothetical protein [Streptomyces sp. V1I1]MDQ0946010.1 hypothetical protein [Streptomyces sp. V1I1]
MCDQFDVASRGSAIKIGVELAKKRGGERWIIVGDSVERLRAEANAIGTYISSVFELHTKTPTDASLAHFKESATEIQGQIRKLRRDA